MKKINTYINNNGNSCGLNLVTDYNEYNYYCGPVVNMSREFYDIFGGVLILHSSFSRRVQNGELLYTVYNGKRYYVYYHYNGLGIMLTNKKPREIVTATGMKLVEIDGSPRCKQCGRILSRFERENCGEICELCNDVTKLISATQTETFNTPVKVVGINGDFNLYADETKIDIHQNICGDILNCFAQNYNMWLTLFKDYVTNEIVIATRYNTIYGCDCRPIYTITNEIETVRCSDCGASIVSDFDGEECPCCGGLINSIIGTYHEHKDYYRPITKNNETELIGFELEIDNENHPSNYDKNECALAINSEYEHLVFEYDGSIEGGFEIISQPHSFECAYDIPFDKICNVAKSYGYSSHDIGTCGFHMHISRCAFGNDADEIDETVLKIQLFLKTFWEDYVKFSRRNEDQIDDWAHGFYGISYNDILRKYKPGSRYQAVNLCPKNTIEFRAMRGSLNPKALRSSMDFHINLVRNARKLSRIDMFDTNKVLNGLNEETISYMIDRNCFVTFNSVAEELIGGDL